MAWQLVAAMNPSLALAAAHAPGTLAEDLYIGGRLAGARTAAARPGVRARRCGPREDGLRRPAAEQPPRQADAAMDIHHSDTPGTSPVAAPGGVTVAAARCDAAPRGRRSAAAGHPNRPRHDKVCHRAGSPYSAAVRRQPRYTPWLYLHAFNNRVGPIGASECGNAPAFCGTA
jgi:hypothetical protein